MDEGTIGASAEVIPVTFEDADGNSIAGEYVAGGWKPISEPTPVDSETIEQTTEWESESVQRKLRWSDDKFVYEMVAFGGNGDIANRDLLLEEMVAIASSMD